LGLLCLDLPLFLACLSKILEGGVVPVLLAGGVAMTMFTWHRGRLLVRRAMSYGAVSVEDLAKRFAAGEFQRVSGTQVFVVRKPSPDHAVSSILEQYRRVRVIGERVVILLLEPTWKAPTSSCGEVQVKNSGGGLWVVHATHGYMAEPDVPKMMQRASHKFSDAFSFEIQDTFFVVAREVILACPHKDMRPWQRHFFAFLSRNVVTGPHFLNIPADRLILYNWLLRLDDPGHQNVKE
jgi:KUP system potassium uptake protein